MLPDVLQENLKVVFCGTAAGKKSAELKNYYAHPGNKFYRILHDTGLTPRLLTPSEFCILPQFGIGLTDLNQSESGMDHQLSHAAFNISAFQQKMERYQPRIVAFTSKKAASKYFGVDTGKLQFGEQQQAIKNTRIFILPSTSGAAQTSWDEKIWYDLAKIVKAI